MSQGIFFPTRVDDAPRHTLGSRMMDDKGTEYVYVQAAGAIAADLVCRVDQNNQADACTQQEGDGHLGGRLGISHVALADDEYGWLIIYGPCTLTAGAAGPVKGVQLYLVATDAGKVDDAASAAPINGLFLNVTIAADNGKAAGYANYPSISDTQ